jgi:hypothetical protein
MKTSIQNLFITLALLASLHKATAQGTTAFTYQGQIHDNGTNANGAYTMIFKLYDAVSGGNQIGSAITTSATLANGLFSVNLDFGAGAFNGGARWLDITVTNGPDTQTLSPRLPVLPEPYAQFASVAATVTNGAIGSSQLAPNLTVSGTLTVSTNLQIGGTGWSISNIGSYTSSSGSLTNTLLFSSGGIPYITCGNSFYGSIVGVMSDVLFAANQITSHGSIEVQNSGSYTSVVQLNTDGSIVAMGDVTCKDLWASNNISCSNLTASGTVFAKTFDTTSDRNLKEKFAPIDNQEILQRVASLPISRWNFKTDGQTRHIGPMAQDFYAAFNVGTDDKHIATVDEDGVALAAIQGLNEKLKEKDARIEALEKRLADLEQLIKTSTRK